MGGRGVCCTGYDDYFAFDSPTEHTISLETRLRTPCVRHKHSLSAQITGYSLDSLHAFECLGLSWGFIELLA